MPLWIYAVPGLYPFNVRLNGVPSFVNKGSSSNRWRYLSKVIKRAGNSKQSIKYANLTHFQIEILTILKFIETKNLKFEHFSETLKISFPLEIVKIPNQKL